MAEYLDPQGRVHRVSKDRDGHRIDLVVASDRLQCSTCGWQTSSLVDASRPRPSVCLCGGRLVRVG